MDRAPKIAAAADVPRESSLLFTVRDVESDENREAILVETEGDVEGWINDCQHFTHIPLDKGTGAEMRDGEIICTNHGAYFDSETGLCTYGPCEGAYLEAIEIAIEDGDVYLVDDQYEFVRRGPDEADDLDRTSKSNVKF